MPSGPRGQYRPADLIGCAVMTARLATGEIEELLKQKSNRIKSGQAGAKARAESLTKKERMEIARKAANTRWKN